MKHNNNNFIDQQPLNTAVLFLVFNRLDNTKQVFEAIRQSKPPRLYIAADGARKVKEGEEKKVKSVRDYILSNIDWKCEVKTLFQDQNLGCKMAVSGGIDWFFENEEMGIILEDDCLPSIDFFRFCEEQLNRYKEDLRIGHICGCNFQGNIKRGESDYYYSRLTHVWGWASWRRVWQKYDINIKDFDSAKNIDFLSTLTNNKKVKSHLYDVFNKTQLGQIDTWDYQYFHSNLINGFLSVIPNNNMITNLGFNGDSTHTSDVNSYFANIKHKSLPLYLKHPSIFVADRSADNSTLEKELPYINIIGEIAKKLAYDLGLKKNKNEV